MKNYKQRRGIVDIDQEFYNNPDNLKEIFSHIHPIKIETQFNNKYRLYAYSLLFDKLKEGEITPEYKVFLKTEEDEEFVYVRFAGVERVD